MKESNMKKYLIAFASAFTLFTAPIYAHEFKAGGLEIIHPSSRAMLPGAPVAGGYLTIVNHGKTDDRLVSVTSDRAAEVQLHEMAIENDVMKMRELPEGIPIPAGSSVELKSGGLHVMFMKVKRPFKEGDMVKATLVFEKAGPVEVEFMVGPASGAAGDMGDHHSHSSTGAADAKP